MTVGSAKSTYKEGNSTIQFSVVNTTATYNVTTNEPNPPALALKRGRFVERETGIALYGKVLKPATQ